MNFAEQRLSELAINYPMMTEVFRRNRLDFCCGGKQSLRDACAEKGLDIQNVIKEIEQLQAVKPNHFDSTDLSEIPGFIITRYHDDLRRRFPELISLAQKVERVHAKHPHCPHGLFDLLTSMHEELLIHMMKEENVLFPMIQSGKGAQAGMPVKVMMMEHDNHGRQLDEIHKLTFHFSPPQDACTTWKVLYTGVEKLEEELMEHIHLENNILFPRALAQI